VSLKVSMLARRARLPAQILLKRRPFAKSVLMALADRADDDGGNSWPAVATIAAETEISRRTVLDCLADLKAAGLIEEQAPSRQHQPTTWRLRLDVLEASVGQVESVPRGALPARLSGPRDDSRGAQPAPLNVPEVRAGHPEVRAEHPRRAGPAPDPSVNGPERSDVRATMTQDDDAAAKVLRLFADAYAALYGQPYAFQPGRDRQRARTLADAHSLTAIGDAIAAYFAPAADPYYRTQAHPFAMFVKQFDRIRATRSTADAEPATSMSLERTAAYLRSLKDVQRARRLPAVAMLDRGVSKC
jgi:hypothetical protein